MGIEDGPEAPDDVSLAAAQESLVPLASGAGALRRHLDKWIGREADALIERDGFARLPDFTGVAAKNLTGPTARLRFAGHDNSNLIGVSA